MYLRGVARVRAQGDGIKPKLRLWLALLGACTLCTVAASISIAQQRPSVAPVNPAFGAFRLALARGMWPTITPQGYALGDIPLLIDMSQVRQQIPRPAFPREGYDPYYDLRDVSGKLPPVRSQGGCGSCWAFATYSSLECCLRPGEIWDFSEHHLTNTHGFDWGPCDGGNRDLSAAYLARWSGPIDEADDPYDDDLLTGSPSGLSPQKHIQGFLYLPVRTSSTDNDTVKQAVMDYGAIHTSMHWHWTYYNIPNYAYYYTGEANTNHAVAIVGWDDDFPASSFNAPPAGDGAFIIRNSWGATWGDSGYFYISYYDTQLGRTHNTLFLEAEETTNYPTVYEYDPLGRVSGVGWGDDWFANVFTAAYLGEELRAVSFYAAVASSSYQVSIYRNPTTPPASGTAVATESGTFTYGGYHTLTLSSPVTLSAGDTFSIVVQLTTPGYDWPIPIERVYAGYSSGATASPGQSYFSPDGSAWMDLTAWNSTANCCIKAFTSPGPTAVRVTDLCAQGECRRIRLTWRTAIESNTVGFNVLRSNGEGRPFHRANTRLIPAAAETDEVGRYSFLDETVRPGSVYYYRIADVLANGMIVEHPETASGAAWRVRLADFVCPELHWLLTP